MKAGQTHIMIIIQGYIKSQPSKYKYYTNLKKFLLSRGFLTNFCTIFGLTSSH
jgi:hypothetical protein